MISPDLFWVIFVIIAAPIAFIGGYIFTDTEDDE